MTISDSTANVDVWNDVKTILVAANLKVTNTSTSATTAATVAATYTDRTPVRPMVVVSPVSSSEDSFKFSSNYGRRMFNITVECYAANTLGVDQLADGVEEAMRAATWDGMSIVGVTSDVAFVNPNEAKYHLKALTYTFDRE
jgi:hypothetical protein